MRWFVEVSRVGEGSSPERYCIEAKAWQTALQEARKLRGDSGPLSKFSIELLDDGYRAVDPVQKVRYVVNRAPADAALSAPVAAANGSVPGPTAAVSQPSAAAPRPLPTASSPTAPTGPAAPSQAPTGPAAPSQAPTATAVASTGPAAASQAPAAPSLAPSAPSPSPAPIARSQAPTAQSQAAQSLARSAPGASQAPAAPSLVPSAPSQAPAAPSLVPSAPTAASQAPAASSLVPSAPTAASQAPAAPFLVPRPASPAVAPSPSEQNAGSLTSQALSPAAVVSVPPGPLTVPPRVIGSEQPKAELPKAEPPRVVPSGSPPAPSRVPSPESPRERISVPPAAAAPVVAPFAAPRPSVAPVVAPSASAAPVAAPQLVSVPTATPLPLAMAPTPPAHRVLRTRLEPPRPETPITYREEVYVVDPGTPRDAVEVLLLERFQRVRSELASGPAGQLVRLAVFDVVFDGPPPRPPLGTLAWKDWRGTPVLGFPFFGIEAPLVTSSMPPRLGSDAPAVAPPPNPLPQPFDSSGSVPPAAPRSNGAASSASSLVPPASPVSASLEPAPEPLRPRRAADDDLIGELFERLHELVFETGVVEGAGFVLDVLLELIPCDYSLVQVFDMNTRKFVVVRARGPGLERALLEATPDSDPAIVEIMRRSDAQQFDAASDPRFQQGRWRHARPAPKRVLSGGVSQSGRYLGLIELGDPAGGHPFNDNEVNALSYACGQFAEFVASHPVVIDRDVVLGG